MESPELDRDLLRAGRLGHYTRNFSIIRLEQAFWGPMGLLDPEPQEDQTLVEAAPHPDQENLAEGSAEPDQQQKEPDLLQRSVFVHEYLHYLHNFSTIGGLYDLTAQVRLARLFINTVNKDGRSLGSTVLSPEKQAEVKETLAWQMAMRGDMTPPLASSLVRGRYSLHVTAVDRTARTFKLDRTSLPVESATITIELRTSETAESYMMGFGTSCLTEAIAWEVEKIILSSEPEKLAEEAQRLPLAPYDVTRAVYVYLTHEEPTSETLIRIALLALLSSDPGVEFVNLIGHYQRFRAQLNPERAMEHLAEPVLAAISENLQRVLDDGLAVELDELKKRGALGRGIAFIESTCRKYLPLRAREPFFELDFVQPGLSMNSILEYQAKHPSCPVIEPSVRRPGRLNLVWLGPQPTYDIVSSLGAFQGFMQFSSNHFTKTLIARTDQCRKKACIFERACEAPRAAEFPDRCAERPWENYITEEKEQCWYGYGVGSSRGYVSS